MNLKKLGPAIFIDHYSLQILKVSCDLEILVDFVIEIAWNTPYIIKTVRQDNFLKRTDTVVLINARSILWNDT